MQEFFFIRVDGRYIRVKFSEIIYIEGYKNYIKINTTGKAYLVHITMKRVEQVLPSYLFCRTHKSFIVSLEHIISFDASVITLENKTIPIGDQYKGQIEKKILVLQRDEENIEKEELMSVYI